MDLTPESMGYDRAIVVFSPDGRLFQVEYAREAVKKGSMAVVMIYKDGVLFASRIKHSRLIRPADKIYKIDHFIGAASAGFVGDSRVLVDIARIRAQQHRLLYEERPSVVSIAKFIADRIQSYTQYAGVRPFGVSLLIGGIDEKGKVIYQTDPSGILVQCYARAIGREEEKANEILEKEWNEDLSLKDAISLSIKLLKLEGKLKEEELQISVVDEKQGYREISIEEIKKLGVKI